VEGGGHTKKCRGGRTGWKCIKTNAYRPVSPRARAARNVMFSGRNVKRTLASGPERWGRTHVHSRITFEAHRDDTKICSRRFELKTKLAGKQERRKVGLSQAREPSLSEPPATVE